MIALRSDALSDQHLALFGAIVHWFARYECLMQRAMTKVGDADDASVIALTKGLDFGEKKEALLRLLHYRDAPLDQCDAVRDYLKLPSRLEPLRDDIAHSEWTRGGAEDSIQPSWILQPPETIKALRGSQIAPGGLHEDADEIAEYTLADLAQIAERLAQNYGAFRAYLEEIGRI